MRTSLSVLIARVIGQTTTWVSPTRTYPPGSRVRAFCDVTSVVGGPTVIFRLRSMPPDGGNQAAYFGLSMVGVSNANSLVELVSDIGYYELSITGGASPSVDFAIWEVIETISP